MADIKISGLTAAASANGAMQLEVNDAGSSKSVTVNQIQDATLGTTNGLIARTGANSVVARAIAASTGILVSNGDGVNGNPTIAIDSTALSSSLPRSARTSNTALAVGDKGRFIDITSGTFTQTFAAASALGSGWFCYIRNAGTGDITLDPNGSETIDGLASFIMYPGEVRLVQCDGSTLRSIVLQSFSKTFTASGTWVKPPGYLRFGGRIVGGGGSGAKTVTANGSSSGGSGGAGAPFDFPSSKLSASETVTVGAGAAGVSASNALGNTGGESSFAGILAGGGFGGTTSTTTSPGGGSVSTPNSGFLDDQTTRGGGGNRVMSLHGGGAGASMTASNATGGSTTANLGGSVNSGSGGTSAYNANAGAGQVPGGGGGGLAVFPAENSVLSGPGASGQVGIWGIV